jgi:hypothetical protein
MKRFRFAGVGAAVLALSAMALASTASAVTFLLAEWLENALAITETMLTEMGDELTVENTKAPEVGNAAAKCSGTLVGDIGVDGAEDSTELLDLKNVLIDPIPLNEPALLCTDVLNCEMSKAWAVHLPWLTLLELWEIGSESGFVILMTSPGSTVGWYVECTVLGVVASEECTASETAAEAKNVSAGVEAIFSDAFTELMGLNLATCSVSKTETGIVTGSGLIVTSLAGPLTVSE